MNFHIEKIYLWFSQEDKTCLTFEKNKVNVIRGNSSRGKSNLFAIIDYCLMSDKPNIVEPIINECTEYYGIEFVINNQYYAISRKKPESGTGADKVYMINEPFAKEYYPNNANKQIADARRELDRAFDLKKEDYIYPWGKVNGVPLLTVSFRSFLMFNALTENIISSQYEFLNYKFFEDIYVDAKEKRDYLMDVLLGIDSVLEKKQKELLQNLASAHNSSIRMHTKYKKSAASYADYLHKAEVLCLAIKPNDANYISEMSDKDKFEYMKSLIVEYEPRSESKIIEAENQKGQLRKDLYKKKMQLLNIRNAQKEYAEYLTNLETISEELKPVEYLKEHLPKMGRTIWTNHILTELSHSLSKLKEENRLIPTTALISETNINNLKEEIAKLEYQLEKLSKIKLKPQEQSMVYYAVGQLKTLLPILQDAYSKIPVEKPQDYDYVHDKVLRDKANQILNDIHLRRSTVVSFELDKYIQEVYDKLTQMDNFRSCVTRYNRDHERLELSDGKSILNYTNIGSQSNYMFLHICFFLGLHRFLHDNPCNNVAQFLFIDQPSVPYYENKDSDKSNDKSKLQDAFSVINSFMKEMVEDWNQDFQILLIEHADESFWTGDNKLEYFTTKANFDGDNALVPFHVIKKKKYENNNR